MFLLQGKVLLKTYLQTKLYCTGISHANTKISLDSKDQLTHRSWEIWDSKICKVDIFYNLYLQGRGEKWYLIVIEIEEAFKVDNVIHSLLVKFTLPQQVP